MDSFLGLAIAFYLCWQWGKKHDERIKMRKRWKAAFENCNGRRRFFYKDWSYEIPYDSSTSHR